MKNDARIGPLPGEKEVGASSPFFIFFNNTCGAQPQTAVNRAPIRGAQFLYYSVKIL